MEVSVESYRAAIGGLNCSAFCSRQKILIVPTLFYTFSHVIGCGLPFLMLMTLISLLLQCGDVEVNPGPPRNLTLNIGHVNARSLNIESKFEEISSLVLDHKFYIFAVSETWLNQSISNDVLSIPAFSPLFWRDRNDGRRAGGVALYIASSVAANRRGYLHDDNFEVLWVETKIFSHVIIFGVCY